MQPLTVASHMKLRLPETVKILNVEHRTSNIERPILWRYALSILKQANHSLRRALRPWAQSQTTPFGKLRAWVCQKQPIRISKGRFALLSLFLNWQNSLFDVGRSMFDVRCSFLVNSSCETTLPKYHFRSNWPAAALNPWTLNPWTLNPACGVVARSAKPQTFEP